MEGLDLVKNPADIRLKGNSERREKQTDRDTETPGWMDRIIAPIRTRSDNRRQYTWV